MRRDRRSSLDYSGQYSQLTEEHQSSIFLIIQRNQGKFIWNLLVSPNHQNPRLSSYVEVFLGEYWAVYSRVWSAVQTRVLTSMRNNQNIADNPQTIQTTFIKLDSILVFGIDDHRMMVFIRKKVFIRKLYHVFLLQTSMKIIFGILILMKFHLVSSCFILHVVSPICIPFYFYLFSENILCSACLMFPQELSHLDE